MEILALVLATMAFFIGITGIIVQVRLVKEEKKVDKFSKYRNQDGLLGRKKVK